MKMEWRAHSKLYIKVVAYKHRRVERVGLAKHSYMCKEDKH